MKYPRLHSHERLKQFYAWLSFSRIISFFKKQIYSQRITLLDITLFFRQFATLISASVPLTTCCDILAKSQEKPAVRLFIHNIHREILSGKTLFHSFSRHPHLFSELICHLIRIGEHTGKLDMMLNIIAIYLEKKLAFRKRIIQISFYPCIVLLTGLVITLSLFIFVIPRFAELFAASEVPLPALTKAIFYFSAHLPFYFGCFLLMMTSMFIFQYRRKSHLFSHTKLRQFIYDLPFIKSCRLKISLARFTSNLSITFTAGIPISDALMLSANTCNDTNFVRTLMQVRNQINAGMQLHRAMETFPEFPALMVHMIKIGEQSGKLSPMLDSVTDILETDLNTLFSRLGQLVEPLIMIVLGVLIGGLVIGMYLPIFKLGSTL